MLTTTSKALCFFAAFLSCTSVTVGQIKIQFSAKSEDFHGEYRFKGTADTDFSTNVIVTATGYNQFKVVFGSSSNIAPINNAATQQPLKIPFASFNRDISVTVTATSSSDPKASNVTEAKIHIDTIAPAPLTPVANRLPGGSGTVQIPFKQSDLDPQSVLPSAFSIYEEFVRNDGQTVLAPILFEGNPTPEDDNRIVVLSFNNLNPGNYWIAFSALKDKVGNEFATAGFVKTDPNTIKKGLPFTVLGGRKDGEQVEFPQFLRPGDTKDEFNPGDRVDTRVVQLFYFRDGERVAELINRNVENLNQEGYDQAQQFAAKARKAAEEKIDARRFQETKAVESARATREIQRKIDEDREKLEQAYAAHDDLQSKQTELKTAMQAAGAPAETVDASIATTKEQLDRKANEIKNPTPLNDIVAQKQVAFDMAKATFDTDTSNEVNRMLLEKAEKELSDAKKAADPAQMQADLRDLQNKLTVQQTLKTKLTINGEQFSRVNGQIDQLETALGDAQLPSDLQNQQELEIEDRHKVVEAEASELRAAQEQFRRELAAGMAELDTYAKGKKESIDPVTQVSISVVGTSRLQLRGPIKGINKICRMIHQIDSPVGQVKVGIHTIQVNGEHGDRMDFVYERINQEVAHSRFLVNASGQLLRRAVNEVAAEVALAADQGYLPDGCPPELSAGHATMNGTSQTTPDIRDRRYLYAFFGSDFIGELEEMDSELLNTENKMLSLHSMDTISLAGALSVASLADNPVRVRILQRFQELLTCDLPDREMEYVRSLTHVTSKGKSLQNRFRTATRIDEKNAEEIYFNASRTYTFPNTVTFFTQQIPGQGVLNPVQYSTIKLAQTLKAQLVAEMELNNLVLERSLLETKEGEVDELYRGRHVQANRAYQKEREALQPIQESFVEALNSILQGALTNLEVNRAANARSIELLKNAKDAENSIAIFDAMLETGIEYVNNVDGSFRDNVTQSALIAIGFSPNDPAVTNVAAQVLVNMTQLKGQLDRFQQQLPPYMTAKYAEEAARADLQQAEEALFSKRLLEQFIDEQEEKSVELMEALRSHSSNVDNYLKRMAIGLEDDVAAQFYEPAFQRIRRVSRTWDVTLGQIETTTVLTNNRTLAKVSPSASFEFDLPKRDIMLAEAINGSKALADEYGNLLKDGTFLAGASMLSGQPATGVVGSNAPVQSIPGLQKNKEFGSDLEKLIPDPEIYKFETGTGFEIRPVIQPDGNSIVYAFDYLYSTNVREPVRADEKHLGRIKRHFVHTDVQTSSYELREISRYTVALKASRTERGVPLFEDLPGVGALFRPLPSDESSLQTNIILGSSVIYPTVFDLMGLRWSRYVDDMGSPGLADQKLKQSTRRDELRSNLLRRTTGTVNHRIGIPTPRTPTSNQITPGYLTLP